MAGPWEAYQESGPWSQYGVKAPEGAPPIGPEIAGGVTDALKSAGSNIADYLNPFSESRHASYAKQAQLPIGQALGENLSQIGGTGAALATPLTAPGNVASAIATPPVAHGFQALNQFAGIDLPYDQAKSQAETALMGIRAGGASANVDTARCIASANVNVADSAQRVTDCEGASVGVSKDQRMAVSAATVINLERSASTITINYSAAGNS